MAHEASESEPLLIKTSRESRREVLFSAFVAEYLGWPGGTDSKSRHSDFCAVLLLFGNLLFSCVCFMYGLHNSFVKN